MNLKYFYLLFLVIFVFSVTTKLYSQCTNCGSQYPSATQSTTSSTLTTISTLMYGSDYAVCNVISGNTYTWTTCGDTDFDTQLSLIQGTGCGGASLAYNDDACGVQSTITWTATFTGVVSILVSEYNCLSNSTFMTLQWSVTGSTTPTTAGDCSSATNVCTNLGFQIDANGIGSVNEIPALGTIGNPDNNNPGGSGNSGCLRVGEKNSTWMIINIGSDGNLEFNFGGSSQAGYYDWIMYPYSQTSCNDIPNGLVAPVRCNWNGSSTGGTGLAATVPFGGSASNFEPPLPVQCGEQYIICFSNYSAALSNVPLQFSGTATVQCMDMTCAGNAACNTTPGSTVYQNCIGAIPVCQNYFCQESSFSGVGSVTGEIPVGNTCLGSGEKNDSWYTFTVQQSGNLSFTITPNTGTDDYDWAVFNLTNATCAQIPTDATLDVSCNYSANIGCAGLTGPNGENVNCAGQNENVIPVLAGETYVVNVSNFSSTQSGYVLDFSASTAVIFDNVPPVLDQLTSTPACGATSLVIRFSEQVLCSSVQACDFTVTGPGGPYTVSGISGVSCAAGGTQGAEFTVNFTPALTVAGSYNINLVPGCGFVQDLCGNIAPAGTIPFTISGLTATPTQTNVACFGGNNGSATVTLTSAGGSPYTYSWSDGTIIPATAATTSTISSLTAGVYTVTITNSSGCSITQTFTITQPPQVTITLTPVDASCGSSTGSIAVSVTGGTPNYNYSCPPAAASNNNPASSYTFNGLAAGSYTVTVTTGAGCQVTGASIINSTGSVTSTFTYNGNHCAGLTPFDFTNTGSTGAGTTYSWTFPGGTPSSSSLENPTGITWLTSGSNTVTHTVTQGTCVSTSTMSVTAYPIPDPNIVPANADCFGVCNGVATSNPTGGTTFSYAWSNLQTSQAITGLCAGNYTVTVTNSDGCIGTESVSITEPAALNLVTARTDVTCFGLCDGSATVTVTPVGVYTYNWSGGSTPSSATTSALCVGTYNITVTSTPGCTATGSIAVGEPADLVLSTTTTDATCGNPTGTATVSVTNGFTPFSYSWNTVPVQTMPTATGLITGAYTVTVTDSHGCIETAVANVTSSNGPSASIVSSTNVSCNGQSDGSAVATASGGVAPLTYLWDSGTAPLNTTSVSGINAGIHTITVTDANNCIATASVTITQPTALTVTTSLVNAADCGQPTGSLQATPNGGTGTYTFAWNSVPTQVTQTAVNLLPGTYTVIVTDNNLCTASANGTINNLPGVALSVKSTTPTLCNGSCDGTASLELMGGLPGYNYVCSNGFTVSTASLAQSVTGLCAGAYTVTVTDANGCTAVAGFTITQPAPVVATISGSADASCFNGNDGTASVVGSGGSAPYTGVWSTIPVQNGLSASGLTAGAFTVTISDANNCTAVTTVNISQPAAITLTTTKTNAHCGLPDGTATVTATGGSAPYTVVWNTIPPQLSVTATGLMAGTYSVVVTDANNCTATANVSINDISSGTATISTFTDVTCFGLSDGTATASIGGGVAPYSYQWNTVPVQSGSTATNLPAGIYIVNITDANLCTVSATVTITEPAQIMITNTPVNVLCFGDCNGQITASVTGGTLPYSYQWSNFQITPSVSNLCAGSYTLSVFDSRNCSQSLTSTITQPSQIIITGAVTNAHCNQNDGSVDIEVSGGSGTYTFLWSNGTTAQDLSAVPSGSYSVIATDQQGCKSNGLYSVNNISGPVAAITSSQDITCFGFDNGLATVTATPSPGMAPIFTYVWNSTPAQFTTTATNLGPGVYIVTVTDTSGCTANASVTIVEPAALTVQPYTMDPLCFGDCNGMAWVVPVGGTVPYSYLWPAGGVNPTDSMNTGMCAGSYTIITTDANNCNNTQSVTLTQPPFMSATTAVTPLLCSGNCNGNATVNTMGGSLPYSFLWSVNSNAQTTQTATGLCPGVYDVTVTDDHNCTTTSGTVVTSPLTLTIQLSGIQHVNCFGQATGRIDIIANGGTPGYSFLWSNGATSQNLVNITYGNYCVTVTDNNGCTYDTCIIISQPPLLQVSVNAQEESCSGLCDGFITPNVIGGQQPYSYLWSNFDNQMIADSLCPGIFNLTVTDFNGCQAMDFDTVEGHQILDILMVDTAMATCGQSNGSAVISAIGGSWTYTYHWPSVVNSISSTATGLAAGAYIVTVIDALGCRDSLQINISNAAGPVIDSIIIQNVSCYNAHDGVLQAYYHGSTSSYSVVWNTNPPQLGNQADSLVPGSYSVVITDANGCVTSAFRTISQPVVLLSAVTNHTDPTCYNVCNGNATVMASGGTQPYTYIWSQGGSSSTATSLCAGFHQVTIVDAHFCTSSSSVTLTQPDSIHISAAVSHVSCNGQHNGQILLTVTGGTGYVFTWAPPVSTNAVAAPLYPGTYSVVVSDYNDYNCSKTKSFTITEPDPVTLTTGHFPTTCGIGNGMAFISTPVQGGTPPYTYQWAPGNNTNDTLFNAYAGTYSLQITDANGCTDISYVSVSSVTPPVVKNITATNISCYGANDGSALITTETGSSPFNYSWTPSNGADSIISPNSAVIYGLSAGTYVVTITDSDSCKVSTAFLITQPSKVMIHANGNQWICIGQQATITANASGGYTPYHYNWIGFDTLQTQLADPDSTTDYFVVVRDNRNCPSDTVSVRVYVYPPITVDVVAFPDAICKNTSSTLTVNTTGGNGQGYNWDWLDLVEIYPYPEREVSPSVTTTYFVTGSDNCGSPGNTDSVTVVVYPLPVTGVRVNKLAGCEPLKVYFYNSVVDSNYLYYWKFEGLGSGNHEYTGENPSHLFEDDGEYFVYLTVTDMSTSAHCSDTAIQKITVYPNPDAEFYAWSEQDGTTAYTANLFHPTLQFEDASTETIANRIWDFGDGRNSGLEKPLHSYETAGVYNVWLYVKTDMGCKDSVMHPVTITDEFTIYVPTAFAPNSPIIENREFFPLTKGLDDKNYHFWIFDRWGEVIFETSEYCESQGCPGHWNGKVNNRGDEVKCGSYVWYVWAKDKNGKTHEKTGPVTVIR